jgi:hypothetical protein
MTEPTMTKKKTKDADSAGMDPVHVVRHGAIAASIWQRQSPSGFAYYDFTLSRSWKSQGTGKAGYSKSFFAANKDNLLAVIDETTAWIAARADVHADGAAPAPALAA